MVGGEGLKKMGKYESVWFISKLTYVQKVLIDLFNDLQMPGQDSDHHVYGPPRE